MIIEKDIANKVNFLLLLIYSVYFHKKQFQPCQFLIFNSSFFIFLAIADIAISCSVW